MIGEVHISAKGVSLTIGSRKRQLAATWWCTECGAILSEEEIDLSPRKDASEIVVVLSAHEGQPFEQTRPSRTYTEAAIAVPDLPRVVKWAAMLRCLSAMMHVDLQEIDVRIDLGGDPQINRRDASRAAALIGCRLRGSSSPVFDEQFVRIERWRRRLPWAILRGALPDNSVLISDQVTLPARKGFGLQYAETTEFRPENALDGKVGLLLEDELVSFDLGTLQEFAGSREFEVRWGRDGVVNLDFVVERDWRPLPLCSAGPWKSDSHSRAAKEYAILEWWRNVLLNVRCNVVELGVEPLRAAI